MESLRSVKVYGKADFGITVSRNSVLNILSEAADYKKVGSIICKEWNPIDF